jgi:peptidoglycan/xylan/chitin deacetylase (PgdA/CDA1 family)
VIGRRSSERVALRKLCGQSRALCLTYDDGPGRALTPEVLDVLRRRRAKATFFLLGRRAEAAPEVADLIHEEGHEIGCHAHDHLHAWKSLPWRAAADVERGYETLSRWLPDPCLFRPPYGKLTPVTRSIATRHGSTIGWWTVDSGDTYETLPSIDAIVEQVRSSGGASVLMHDFDREPERAVFVVSLTKRLLELAAEESLEVLPLGDLLSRSIRSATA